jgi:D-alanyl-D-alanine carboxypeptidase (penicillin-binding protein 5/6)
MASTTKIMTALLVLERSALDELVVVSPNALVGESNMGLVAGEQLSVEDLLWGLLLNSANDAAVALAEHVAGSEAAFVELMNQRAAELGLTGTQFANVHGLDAPNHASTARDLWRLAEVAMQSPVFRQMVATQSYTAAGHPLWNRNELLAIYPGADGIKTGTTDLAGQCLVASVTRDGHRAVAVILGSQDRYRDAQVLFDHDAITYRWMPAPQLQGPAAWVRSPDGRPWRVVAPDAPDLFLPRWQWPLVRAHATLNQISGDPTQPAGTLRWDLGGTLLAEAPAFLSQF